MKKSITPVTFIILYGISVHHNYYLYYQEFLLPTNDTHASLFLIIPGRRKSNGDIDTGHYTSAHGSCFSKLLLTVGERSMV